MDNKEYIRLDFLPGVTSNITQHAIEGGWYDSDKVRFRDGKPRSIGGWVDVNGVASTVTFQGKARGLHTWTDYTGIDYVAFGTDKKLYIWKQSSNFVDITPVRTSTNLSNNFNTSVSSNLVLITATGHGGADGDIIAIVSATISLGNTILLTSAGVSTEYTAIVSNANTFWVSTASVATSALSQGGGTAILLWYLPIGRTDATPGLGWGAGAWGVSTWGTARGTGILQPLRTWALDSWGQTLVAAPHHLALYQWGLSETTRASVITAAPSIIDFLVVSPEDQHVICVGTHDESGTYNPLLVRWCSQGNLTDWATSATNTAGSKTLSGKGKLVSAMRGIHQILLFTDTALYSMTHQGPPLTFAFDIIGDNCGIIAPHARVFADGRAFWMGHKQFFYYDGAVHPLKCPVRNMVFDILHEDQASKTYAGHNSQFNEITWFFQSLSASEVDRYVSYNYVQDCWYYGTLARTSWMDADIFTRPVAAGTDGKLYFHESGVSANGDELNSYIESGFMNIKDGTEISFVDAFVPDFEVSAGSLNVTLRMNKYPQQTPTNKGPIPINSTTGKKGIRARGRQLAVRVSGNGKWVYGSPLIRIKSDGER